MVLHLDRRAHLYVFVTAGSFPNFGQRRRGKAGRGRAPRPAVGQTAAVAAMAGFGWVGTFVPSSTTFKAWVFAASPNTSYAFIASSIGKWCVASTVGSS